MTYRIWYRKVEQLIQDYLDKKIDTDLFTADYLALFPACPGIEPKDQWAYPLSQEIYQTLHDLYQVLETQDTSCDLQSAAVDLCKTTVLTMERLIEYNTITYQKWYVKTKQLIQDYIDKKMSAKKFDIEYLYLSSEKPLSKSLDQKAIHYILHDLWYEAEDYDAFSNPEPEQEALYQAASVALRKLKDYEISGDFDKVCRESETFKNWSNGSL